MQGVGFRWFVREQARRSGIAGWVRNNPDGSVEIAARGESDAIERFAASVRHGPEGAVVESVETLHDETEDQLPTPFVVMR